MAHVVGVLHPGAMGAALAAQVRSAGARVLWCREGRSATTGSRAASAGLEAVDDLGALVEQAELVISICPPEYAEVQAEGVARLRAEGGVYLDANATSPAQFGRIAGCLGERWSVLDGAVIGSPPVGGKSPRLYVSGDGEGADLVDEVFAGTDVQVRRLTGGGGEASALKLSYTAFQKASRVLAALSYGLAAEHGVEAELLDVAGLRGGSYLSEPEYIPKVAARAWRWGPELDEAAAMLEAAGLPGEMVKAASAALGRWAESRDDAAVRIDGALEQLRRPGR